MKKFVLGLLSIFFMAMIPLTGFSDEKAERPAPSEPPPAIDPPEIEKVEPEKLKLDPLPVDDVMKPKKEEDVQNREYSPISKGNLFFPKKSLKRRMGGVVLVEYTITPEGIVTDIKILEETPIKYGFGEAAINSVKTYKYNPRIIDGVAVEVKGVKTKITFAFADGY